MLPLKDEFATRLNESWAASAGVATGAVAATSVSATAAAAAGLKSKGPRRQFDKPPKFEPPKRFEFAELMESLNRFSNSVEQAIRLDQIEFMALIASASVLNPLGGAGIAALSMRFQIIANDTRAKLQNFRSAVIELGKWAPIPDELLSQADRWDKLAERLIERANQVQDWQTVPGWNGVSADEYAATTQVQANALAELAGIMASSGKSASSAAALNMAAFSALSKLTVMVTARLRGLPGLGFNFSFHRTKSAGAMAGELAALLLSVQTMAILWASPLPAQISATLTAPNLLSPGNWPSGNSKANVTAADTDGAITPSNYYSHI